MNSEDDLIQKLMASKKIMDKHNAIPRNTNRITNGMVSPSTPMVEDFQPVRGQYNIPEEFNLGYSEVPESQPIRIENTEQRIMSTKLPDEIKRLMIENPIVQPGTTSGPTLSNDLVEKASRLMNNKQPIKEQQRQSIPTTGIPSDFRGMLKEVITEVLTEKGMISESSSNSNETFTFKVGKHIFEGKVLKIKKTR
jgi:hypothetical protein